MSDKNSDKSKRETEAHELRRDVRREEAGQRRQQRKDACEARHLNTRRSARPPSSLT